MTNTEIIANLATIIAKQNLEISELNTEVQHLHHELLARMNEVDRKSENCSEKPNNYVDEFFREPTAEERKAVADYIDSISVPTGVNVFDLMDEPQTDTPTLTAEDWKKIKTAMPESRLILFDDDGVYIEPQTNCPKSCPTINICTKDDTDCPWK